VGEVYRERDESELATSGVVMRRSAREQGDTMLRALPELSPGEDPTRAASTVCRADQRKDRLSGARRLSVGCSHRVGKIPTNGIGSDSPIVTPCEPLGVIDVRTSQRDSLLSGCVSLYRMTWMPVSVPTVAPKATSLAQWRESYMRARPTAVAPPYSNGERMGAARRADHRAARDDGLGRVEANPAQTVVTR
jgi:hypothetical protein